MKNAKSLIKSPKRNDFVLDVGKVIERLQWAVAKALASTHCAVRDCLAAGQALNEARAEFARRRGQGGEFSEWDDGNGWTEFIEKNLPHITVRTAQLWMRAAANVVRALGNSQLTIADSQGNDAIDVEAIPVSEILATADDELPDRAREWKQAWFDFTEGKTIKQCLAGVFVDGDEGSRVDRAINGMTARQTSGEERKDYPRFMARKLKEMTEHLVVKGTHRMPARERDIDADQRAKILAAFDGAVSVWPRWLLEMLRASTHRELKLSEVERAAHLKEAARRNFVGLERR